MMSAASERLAADLRGAVVNHTDPETVRDGAPAWLLMVDAMAASDPGNARLQGQAAYLYASYAGGFAGDDPERARRLATRARDYGRSALCARRADACGLSGRPYAEFERQVGSLRRGDTEALFAAALGELAWIEAHTDDWDAIADLPRVQFMLERVVELDPGHERGAPHAFLGVLYSLRPPALGGEPERGRAHFEQALEHGGGRDLMTRVLFAEYYARSTYNRGLHDQLLNEVLAADPRAEDFTLANLLAQRRARKLLDGAADHFFYE